MNLGNKPELQERLAAEYALGTLRGAARERFKRWLKEDGALARAAAEWEGRLAPMAEGVAPVAPPSRLWKSISRELDARLEAPRRSAAGFWRGLALVASGAFAAVLVMAVLAPGWLRPAAQASYVALLSDPKTQRPVLYVSVPRRGSELRVRTLDPAIRVSDASLELWALPSGGKPKSLGLVPAASEGTMRLAAPADASLGNVPVLAVSLEPKGGSPTGLPTGPVLYSGPCVKDW